MKVAETVKSVAKPAKKFGAGTVGLIGGSIITSKIPELSFLANIPVVGQYLAKLAPGAAVMFLAYLLNKKFQNDLVQAGAFGLGLAGFANAVKRLTNGTPLQMVSDAVPAGLGVVRDPTNYGQYPPSYYIDSNKAYSRLNGAPSEAYQLNGAGTAYRLSGMKGLGDPKNPVYLLQ